MKTPRLRNPRSESTASTIVVAMITLVTLAIIATTVLETLNSRYNYAQKVIGWNEALYAADAGADFGLANCRLTLSSGAWTGWKKYNSASSSWVTVTDTADANSQLTAAMAAKTSSRRVIFNCSGHSRGERSMNH